jgi:hypothetical protein
LLVGEAVIAVRAVEARIARRLASFDATEECLECSIQARKHILQHLRMHVAVFRAYLLDVRQLGTLTGSRDAHPALLPGVATLLQASVVEFAATAHDKRQRALLLGSGHRVARKGLAYRNRLLLVHSSLFCLIGMQPAMQGAIHPLAQAKGLSGPFSVKAISARFVDIVY